MALYLNYHVLNFVKTFAWLTSCMVTGSAIWYDALQGWGEPANEKMERQQRRRRRRKRML